MRNLLLLLFLLSANLFGYEIKARVGAFFPQEKLFQKIYGSVGPTIELEGTSRFVFPFLAWSNVNVTPMHGFSRGLHDPTEIFIANFSFGLKVGRNFRLFRTYGGIGCVLSGVFIDNRHSICCNKSSKFVAGGVLKFGLQKNMNQRIVVDAFLDYYYQPAHFESRRNVGGLRTGVGVGFLF